MDPLLEPPRAEGVSARDEAASVARFHSSRSVHEVPKATRPNPGRVRPATDPPRSLRAAPPYHVPPLLLPRTPAEVSASRNRPQVAGPSLAALRPVVRLRHPRSGFQPRPGVGRARGAEGGVAMNLMQWQTKPSWGEYEAELLRRGFEPYWDPETQQRISTVRITCCRCGTTLTYDGMTDGKPD